MSGINTDMKLVPELFTGLELKATRAGFGAGMSELGSTNENVVALCADLSGSLKLGDFIKDYPDRFFQSGVAIPRHAAGT